LLQASFWLLTLAVAAGTILALLHLRGGSRPPLAAGLAHAAVGTLGLILLLPFAFGAPRGIASGSAAFGPIAACLLIGALLTGAVVLLRRRNGPVVTMAIHAGLAIAGYVMLLAWYAVG
jgi:hypothetical protein